MTATHELVVPKSIPMMPANDLDAVEVRSVLWKAQLATFLVYDLFKI
jgi:hypothetical protein